MNWILKNKKKNSTALFVVLFLVFGFAFFASDKAKAAGEICEDGVNTEQSCECFAGNVSLGFFAAGTDIGNGVKGFCIQDVCKTFCKSKYSTTTDVKLGSGGLFGGTSSMKNSSSAVETAPTISEAFGGIFTAGVRFILTQIQSLVGWLFAIAATLFAWAIDPANISGETGLLNKQAVKDVWTMVRDLLNMTFILVLLFAAFCTIFQVEKWNLKKVWLNILINALLVNFSYPIARFFIDVSNVAFYYFVNHLFSSTGVVTGSGIMAMFGSSSTISSILKPELFTADPIAYQIAMIVFIFIMGMTLLIVAGLFLIRLIALAMLVMFSPIGFVGYIFPSTAKHADKWWSQLFSYSFFAPIMIFGIAISIRIADALKAENIRSMISNASTNAPTNQVQWVSDMAFYFIPVIILWMFIGVAKSAGIAGADAVVNGVKKGGKWLATHPALGAGGFAWKYSGAQGGVKLGWENYKKTGPLFGTNKMEERAARIGNMLGDHHAVNDVQSKRVKESSDHHDMANMTDPDLQNLNRTGNEFERAAAVLELANRGKADAVNVDTVRKQFGDNSRVFSQLRNKVKTYDPTSAFATALDANGKVATFDTQRMTEHLNSNQFDAKKVNSDALGNAAFVGLAMATGNMKSKDIEELAGKGGSYGKNIKKSLDAVLKEKEVDANGNALLDQNGDEIYKYQDMKNENHRNIQMAYLAQKGEIHDSLMGFDPDQVKNRAQLLSRAGKDDLKRLDDKFVSRVGNLGIVNEIAFNVSPGKLKDVLMEMKKETQAHLMRTIRTQNYSPGSMIANQNAETIQRLINRDPQMRSMHQ